MRAQGRTELWTGPGDLPTSAFPLLGAPTPRLGFAGPVIMEFLTHPGRDLLLRVAHPFILYDRNGRPWPVPEGVICDGASIPWGLRIIGGHPLEGDYRRAAVPHDPYCGMPKLALDLLNRHYRNEIVLSKYTREVLGDGCLIAAELGRSRPADETHRMFYDGMEADQLRLVKRRLYYRLVDQFGPRWTMAEPFKTKMKRAAEETAKVIRREPMQ